MTDALCSRTLTARVTAYFSIGMALNADGSYPGAFEHLTDGSSWSSQSWPTPTKSAILQARFRLGYEPVLEWFRRVARPLAGADTPVSWLAGRRVVAVAEYGTHALFDAALSSEHALSSSGSSHMT